MLTRTMKKKGRTHYFLGKNSPEIRLRLAQEKIPVCICGCFEGSVWLGANDYGDDVMIYGEGYSNEDFGTVQEEIFFIITDIIRHNGNVVIMHDVEEFIQTCKELQSVKKSDKGSKEKS